MPAWRVAAVAAALLVIPAASNAQFGRLKDLAKEKISAAEKKKSVDAATPSQASNPPKTKDPTPPEVVPVPKDYGEAKASRVAGSPPSLDVQRNPGPTPEVSLAGGGKLEAGAKQQLVLNVSNIDANAFGSVRSRKPCDKISDFQIISSTQVKLTVDLSAEQQVGDCKFEFHGEDGKYLMSSQMDYVGIEQARDERLHAIAIKEAHLQSGERMAVARKRMGKVWSVEFEGGTKDSWTFVSAPPDLYSKFKFKNSSGKLIEMTDRYGGNVVIEFGKDCQMFAQIENSAVTGTANGGCGFPGGDKWSATIQ